MITNEISKRIFTSIILFPLVIFLITYSQVSSTILLILIFLISTYEWIKINSNNNSFFSILGVVFLLVVCFLAFILRGEAFEDTILFIYIILISISSDIGGYIFGKLFKGYKLTSISPNKTYSGVLGSLTFSFIPIVVYNFIGFQNNLFLLNFNNVLIILLLSMVSQVGDITVSYFKRKNKIKDTGNILPGHGGLLDRIDGILFVIFIFGLIKLFKLI